MKMDFRWCLSVGPVIIWFLSSLPSSQLKTVFLETLRCRVGESLSIEIPDDDQCPLSNFTTLLRVQPLQQPHNHLHPHKVYMWNSLLGWYR
ncbi:uncharacterized protein [Salvelinus sp. IW2-2015]|uniref:uncharacterized protein isoform X4 n=1 Tax=Salvelinus sp. IW2-2015 TaxID=2691554 RepID=UPI0038D4F4AE